MNRFIENPNIPSTAVTRVILDRRVPKSIENKIRAEGINIIKTSNCKDLYEGISCHPDILINHISGNEIIIAPNVFHEMNSMFTNLNFNVIKGDTILNSTYPYNVAYNVCRVGKYIIHNFKYTDREILKKIEEHSLTKINVNQGYSKCSITVVNDNAIITSDRGIAKEVLKWNIDVLLIDPGNIKLPGLDYGFIGGASGLIGKNRLFFSGNITKHPDFKMIQRFLSQNKVEIIYDNNVELIDIGSIIPILEI